MTASRLQRFVDATRRHALACLAAALACAIASVAHADAALRLTDVVGRTVVLERPAKRIILGAWVSFDALALIHPDPVEVLAGWAGEAGANRFQLEPVRKKFPAIDGVPIVGKDTLETMSIEAVIAARPDAVVLSRYDAFRWGQPTSSLPLQQLEAAGIPVVIVDFYLDPVVNTEPSLRLLGRLLGREAQAEAFISLYRARMGEIRQRIERAGPALEQPSVFVHAFAARQDCCWTSGPGVGDGLTRITGGHSIGADVLTSPIGQISLEYVLSRNPDIYVATGGQDVVPGSKFALGRGVSQDTARQGLQTLLARPDLSALGAVQKGRAYGVWQNFAHTPLHLLQAEVFAKWFHPGLFSDLDPEQTLDQITGSSSPCRCRARSGLASIHRATSLGPARRNDG
jgi:iron complex transport system substrate-binding protein